MKYLKLSPLLALFAAVFVTTNANAGNFSGNAVSACKSHIAAQYSGDVKRKVKKIQTRSSQVKVKIRVTAEGEKFNAECLVSRNGDLTYTTDREMNDAIVSKDS